MQESWTRRAAAFFCIVIVLFAAMTLSVSPSPHHGDVTAILTPLWLLFALVVVTLVRREPSRCDDQPVALRSLAPFRAPPASLALV
jgi:hypothetical protein